VALLGLGAVALRRGHGAVGGQGALSVLERHPMAKETGVAVLVTQGRRLVVGYGPAGVALLAELGPAEERVP
jgi:flagellar biogenesis protein FliO